MSRPCRSVVSRDQLELLTNCLFLATNDEFCELAVTQARKYALCLSFVPDSTYQPSLQDCYNFQSEN